MSTPGDVTAVVVALARGPRLTACLASVRAQHPDLEVLCVVVDPDAAPAPDDDPGVRYLHPGVNLGWSGALQFARRRIDRALMWQVQDDMLIEPGALAALLARLDGDDRLAAVRPVAVDEAGIVPTGNCGGPLGDDFALRAPIPPAPVPIERFVPPEDPDFLPSSGTLIRLDAWDAVGGVNPWIHPVVYVDVDLSLALRAAGYRLALVGDARIRHGAGGSTPSLFGLFAWERNRMIVRATWSPHGLPDAAEGPAVLARTLLDAAVAYRRDPRPLDDDELRSIATRSGGDALLRFARIADERLKVSERGRTHAEAAHEQAAGDRDRWHEDAVALFATLERAGVRADDAESRAGEARAALAALTVSRSWRLTAPLRVAARRVRERAARVARRPR